MERLASHLAIVRSQIADAARAAGRDPDEVTLVAVTNAQPLSGVEAVVQAGLRDIGENRPEEAEPKMAGLPAGLEVRWHMIGHVQSRKARAVVQAPGPGFVLVHGVDSFKVGERIGRLAVDRGRRQAVLLQCNVSGEATKSGFPAGSRAQWERLLPAWEKLAALPGLEIRGLMTMAPIVARPDDARPHFARLRELRAFAAARLPQATWTHLSMGMTDDFEAAVAEGATLVRIGRGIFGERPT